MERAQSRAQLQDARPVSNLPCRPTRPSPLQAYISQLKLEGLALTSDMVYVTQASSPAAWSPSLFLLFLFLFFPWGHLGRLWMDAPRGHLGRPGACSSVRLVYTFTFPALQIQTTWSRCSALVWAPPAPPAVPLRKRKLNLFSLLSAMALAPAAALLNTKAADRRSLPAAP